MRSRLIKDKLPFIRRFIFGSIKLYFKVLFNFELNKDNLDIYYIISEYDYLYFSGDLDD